WYANMNDLPQLLLIAQFYEKAFPVTDIATTARFVVDKFLGNWFGLFLVMPVFVPILISSQAVAGEKERRTIEPLLASPISAVELVVGKCLGSLVPAVMISWLASAA